MDGYIHTCNSSSLAQHSTLKKDSSLLKSDPLEAQENHNSNYLSYKISYTCLSFESLQNFFQINKDYKGVYTQIYKWLLGVANALKAPKSVVYCAVNYMFRYLTKRKVDISDIECLGWICFYLADSNMNCQSTQLTFKELTYYLKQTFDMNSCDIIHYVNEVIITLDLHLLIPCPYAFVCEYLHLSSSSPTYKAISVIIDSICFSYYSIIIPAEVIAITSVIIYLSYNKLSLLSCPDIILNFDKNSVLVCLELTKRHLPDLAKTCKRIKLYLDTKA